MNTFLVISALIIVLFLILRAVHLDQKDQIKMMTDSLFLSGEVYLTVKDEDGSIVLKDKFMETIDMDHDLKTFNLNAEKTFDRLPIKYQKAFKYIKANNLHVIDLNFIRQNPDIFIKSKDSSMRSFKADIPDSLDDELEYIEVIINQSLDNFFTNPKAKDLSVEIRAHTNYQTISLTLLFYVPTMFVHDNKEIDNGF